MRTFESESTAEAVKDLRLRVRASCSGGRPAWRVVLKLSPVLLDVPIVAATPPGAVIVLAIVDRGSIASNK